MPDIKNIKNLDTLLKMKDSLEKHVKRLAQEGKAHPSFNLGDLLLELSLRIEELSQIKQ